MKLSCQSCGQEMTLSKKVTHHGVRSKYRIRRFVCTICDITETIYADGDNDLKQEPRRAIEQINKQYKQDETNRI